MSTPYSIEAIPAGRSAEASIQDQAALASLRAWVAGPSRAAQESFAAGQYMLAPTQQTQRYWLLEMAKAAAVTEDGEWPMMAGGHGEW